MFLKIYKDRSRAKVLFTDLYKSQDMPFYNPNGEILFRKKMRAYLVKDEGTLELMARKKFDEDLLTKQELSRGGISSIEANNSSFGSIMCQSFKAKSRGASSLRIEQDASLVNFAPG